VFIFSFFFLLNYVKNKKMPTEKRLKHLERQAKKVADQRTREERLDEITKVREKFQTLGLTIELDEIAAFYKIMDDFVENANPYQGTIGIAGTGREICYQLINNRRHDIGVMLRANDAYR
jgi:hypothetical protein